MFRSLLIRLPRRAAAASAAPAASGEVMAATTRWPYSAPWDAMGWSASLQGNHIFHQAQRQQLQLSCHGASFGRRSLRLSLRNAAAEEAKVEIPKGTLFIPDSAHQQTLICSEDTQVCIDPGGEVNLELDAYCGISSASCPHGTMQVTALQAPSGRIGSQGATWSWTDSFNPTDLNLPAGVIPASQESDLLAQEYPGEDFSKYDLPESTEATADETSTSPGNASSGSDGWSFWGSDASGGSSWISWGGGGGGGGGSGDGGGDGGGGD